MITSYLILAFRLAKQSILRTLICNHLNLRQIYSVALASTVPNLSRLPGIQQHTGTSQGALTLWKRRVLSLLVSMVLAASFGKARLPAQDAPENDADKPQGVFRSEVSLVSVYFTVHDHNKQLASQMEQDRFRVYEDGKEQSIKFFAHHSDVVLNVGVLLDTGTNMAWILGEEAQASSLFLKHVVRPTDLGFVLTYPARVGTLQVPTSDVALREEKVNSIPN